MLAKDVVVMMVMMVMTMGKGSPGNQKKNQERIEGLCKKNSGKTPRLRAEDHK
jgi:hypothetical protein